MIIYYCAFLTLILFSKLSNCDPGQISCGNGKCIERDDVCDGKVDCDNQIDER